MVFFFLFFLMERKILLKPAEKNKLRYKAAILHNFRQNSRRDRGFISKTQKPICQSPSSKGVSSHICFPRNQLKEAEGIDCTIALISFIRVSILHGTSTLGFKIPSMHTLQSLSKHTSGILWDTTILATCL